MPALMIMMELGCAALCAWHQKGPKGLVTNYGEGRALNGRGGGGGGHVKFYPYEKGGGRKKF